jgi:AsmA-like C-terminal region/Protein of unknown function
VSDTANQSQKDPTTPRGQARRRRVLKATLRHTLELLALVFSLVLALCGGLAWRLAQGPVSLEFLRADAETALVQVFRGQTAHIGALQADWSSAERTIVIAARDVQVNDKAGQVLVKVPRFDVGLTALGLLQGKAVLKRIVALGGEFSIVRRADGSFGAGLGLPDQIDLNPPPSKPNAKPGGRETKASLPEVLKRLRVLAMRDATLHFVDERAGVDWVAPHANLQFSRRGEQLLASAKGNIVSQTGVTAISINATSRADFSRMFAELTLKNAVPSALLPQSKGWWAWLGGINAPLNADISFATDDDGLLRSAQGDLQLSKGVYRKNNQNISIENARMVFDFDPVDGAVNIDLAELQSDLLSGTLKGRVLGLDPVRLVVGEQIGFDLMAEGIRYAPKGVFAQPLQFNALALNGNFQPAQKTVQFNHFNLSLFDLSLNGDAALYLPADGKDAEAPLLRLDAQSDGQISPAQILKLWPVDFAFGGRDWIRRNVLSGRLHTLNLEVRLPQRALNARHLDNDMLRLSFLFDEANAHYVNAMTPLRDGEGAGVLLGNRFDLKMDRAKLLELDLTDAFVEIPRLSPKGVTANFGGHATGSLRDVVKLLDEKPLEFVSKYGLSPERISGQGELDFTVSRPMRVLVPIRKVRFSAAGSFEDIRVVGLIAGQDLSGVVADFSADPDGMKVSGKGKLGKVPGSFVWQERFFPVDEPRTRLNIDVVTDEQVFDDLGIPTRLFIDGPMGIHVTTTGEGMNIRSAELAADLTQARLMSPGGDWEKPTGQEGSARFKVTRSDDGGYEIKDFEARTEGFVLSGDLSIAAKGGVQRARISRARMEGLFDLTAKLDRNADGAFVLEGHAASMDARGFVRGLTREASTDFGIALDANITFARALASDALTLTDGVLKFKRAEQDIESLDFTADTPNGTARFVVSKNEDGKRQLMGRTDDAGLVIEALFGASSVKGGVLQLDGVLGDGKSEHTKLELSMQDFKLVNVPVMAKMLTLGSLTGIANTMSGEGIGFKNLVAPLEFDTGTINIGASRATGPALGITVTGSVDLIEKTMNLSGALAPAYSINSALGNIPVLGDVLVSRKGEGLFGLSYKVQGPYEALQVFVNPLSALTPGVLRRIFEGGKRDVTPNHEQTAPLDPGEKGKTQESAPTPAPAPATEPATETASPSSGG